MLDQLTIYFAGGQNGPICQLVPIILNPRPSSRPPLLPIHCCQLFSASYFKSDEIATTPLLLFARWPSVVHDTGINKSWQRKLQNYIRQTLGNNYYPAGSGAESRN